MHNHMKKHLIVIDDTSSPGNFNETRFLKEDRKTLVAVFINGEMREIIENVLSEILSILNAEFGITELHFTDLVNKKNEYKNLDNEDVFGILEKICILFSEIYLPFFVQTVHQNTLKENGIYINGKVIFDKLDLNKNEDNCLLLLLNKLKIFLNKEFQGETIEFVMDEGRKKNGQGETFQILENLAENCQISFRSSNDFLLLQVADFFAYSVNRMQTTIVKEKRTEFDKTIITHISKALEVQYSEGTTMTEVDLDDFSKDDYDYLQRSKREIDGNLDHWQNAQKK